MNHVFPNAINVNGLSGLPRINTATLTDLADASRRLTRDDYVTSMFAFGVTALAALARFVTNFVLAVVTAIPAIFIRDVREFCLNALNRSWIDLTGSAIGLFGFVSPHLGRQVTAVHGEFLFAAFIDIPVDLFKNAPVEVRSQLAGAFISFA